MKIREQEPTDEGWIETVLNERWGAWGESLFTERNSNRESCLPSLLGAAILLEASARLSHEPNELVA